MDNFSQTFLNFLNGSQVISNSREGPTNIYDHNQEAYEYELLKQIIEKPLENELDILKNRNVLVKDETINDFRSIFDPNDEAQKILSGYYINIDESLNIFKQFYDDEPNPFCKFNEGSSQYIKFLQEKSGYNLTNIYSNWTQMAKKQEDSDSDQLIIDTTSENSFMNISDSGIEAENNSPTACPVAKKKLNFDESVEKKQAKKRNKTCYERKRKSKKAKKDNDLVKNIFHISGGQEEIKPQIELKMAPNSPESPRKTSTPFKTPKFIADCQENLENLLLSPILPSIVHNKTNHTSSSFSVQEIQGPLNQEDKNYLGFLEKQFSEAVFEENGRIIYPVALNRDFQGMSYDMEDELSHNHHIKTEFLSKFRKM